MTNEQEDILRLAAEIELLTEQFIRLAKVVEAQAEEINHLKAMAYTNK